MSLLLRELHPFYQKHRRSGDLDGGVEGDRVWMTCTCGARIVREAMQTPADFQSGSDGSEVS